MDNIENYQALSKLLNIVVDKKMEHSGSVSRVVDFRIAGLLVVSLSKTLYPLLSTGLTQEDSPNMTEYYLTGRYRIKQSKQTKDRKLF